MTLGSSLLLQDGGKPSSLLGNLLLGSTTTTTHETVRLVCTGTEGCIRSLAMDWAITDTTDDVHWLEIDSGETEEHKLHFPPYVSPSSQASLQHITVHHFDSTENLCNWLLLCQPSNNNDKSVWILDTSAQLNHLLLALLLKSALNMKCSHVLVLQEQLQPQLAHFWKPRRINVSQQDDDQKHQVQLDSKYVATLRVANEAIMDWKLV